MATCPYCGSQVADSAKFCTECGAALQAAAMFEQPVAPDSYQQPAYQQPEAPQGFDQQYGQQPYEQPQQVYATPVQPVQDSGSIGWGVLGFFFPIVGLILFLVWKSTKPNCAKVAGIGALIGFILSVGVNLLYLPMLGSLW